MANSLRHGPDVVEREGVGQQVHPAGVKEGGRQQSVVLPSHYQPVALQASAAVGGLCHFRSQQMARENGCMHLFIATFDQGNL